MRVVYLDVLFVLNFAMDYCILRCASALSGRPAAVWRLSLAAGFGALYAGGCVVFPPLSVLPVRIASGAVMAGTAFSIRHMRLLVRQTLLVLLVAFVFGGVAVALEQLSGTPLMQNGVLVVQVSRRVLAASALLAYGLSCFVFRNQAKDNRPCGESVCICCEKQQAQVFLLVDSGNTLRDPMTGKPVLLLTRDAAMRILPEQQRFIAQSLKQDNAAELVQQAQQHGVRGWRLLAFHSVGGGGLLPCFRPRAVVRADGSAYDCMVAVSVADIGSGEFDGLIEP